MANKRYDQFTAGSYDAAKIFLIADPDTGALVKIPLSDIPTIYTADGSLSSNRIINLNGNVLLVEQDSIQMLYVSAPESVLQAFNPIGAGNRSFIAAQVNDIESNATSSASFNNGAKSAVTIWYANTSESTITHTADTQTMVAGGETNLSVTINGALLRAFDPTNDNNVSKIELGTSPTNAILDISADFNDGVKEALIQFAADATTSTITHTADIHTFNVTELFVKTSTYTPGLFHVSESSGRVDIGDFDDEVNGTKIELNDNTQTIRHSADHHNFNLQNFANNAAAVGGGLVSGDQYFTNTAGEGLMKIVI